jgi:hypothetical protein
MQQRGSEVVGATVVKSIAFVAVVNLWHSLQPQTKKVAAQRSK